MRHPRKVAQWGHLRPCEISGLSNDGQGGVASDVHGLGRDCDDGDVHGATDLTATVEQPVVPLLRVDKVAGVRQPLRVREPQQYAPMYSCVRKFDMLILEHSRLLVLLLFSLLFLILMQVLRSALSFYLELHAEKHKKSP